MNSVLIKFNSGHARKIKIVKKKTISVASRESSRFLNPDEEQSYRTMFTIWNVLPSIILIVITIRVVGLFSTSENCCSVNFRAFSVYAKSKIVSVFIIEFL